MLITNARIFSEQKRFERGSLRTKGDRIQEVIYESDPSYPERVQAQEGEEVLDIGGNYLLPGMIDSHFHGCAGIDFCDGMVAFLETIANYEAKIGVTSICPATVTLPDEEIRYILAGAAVFKDKQAEGSYENAAHLVGIHMEGPFISEEKCGALNSSLVRPRNSKMAAEFYEASEGLVKFIGLAPEVPATEPLEEFVDKVQEMGMTVSIAHTNADYETARRAFKAGVHHVTHLYNAMPEFQHRNPGVVGALFETSDITVELIADGIHVHPAVIRATLKILGEDQVVFISDSMRGTGMPDGRYSLGGLPVIKSGRETRLVKNGALAGSVTTLPDCVRIAVKDMGIPLETAILCSTVNPAKSLDVFNERGEIVPGKKADLIVWDEDLALKEVFLDGRRLKLEDLG
ncbi:MAG: N-acetylglucosamine-6-phosphate deacetylase [Lachnospiraceae bacterium]|nr:N-acetylglucosamine-6-phosphate deacetylase [Lachnospiraceae bacterium]